MLKLVKPKNPGVLGIDISSSSVKILEISGSGPNLCVEQFGRGALPAHALDGHVIKDIAAVSHCIKKICDQAHFTSKQVVLAVPDSTAISKVMQVDKGLTETVIEELVFIEADKYISSSINEINLDFEDTRYIS